MGERTNDTLAKKRTRSRRVGSTDSIDSNAEALLKSPKDVLALGQAIVRQLKLDTRGAVLERWLAHHLAEVLSEADRETGTKKEATEQRAVDLVLKLWMHRRALPESVDPLGGYRDAIAVLSRLMPDANPWARSRRHGTYEDLLHEMFECMSRATLGGLLLTQVSRVRTVTETESKSLESEEAFIQQAIEDWMLFAPPKQQLPKIMIKFANPGDIDGEQRDASTEGDVYEIAIDENVSDKDESFHLAIIENLERMQKNLGDLLVRWKTTSPDQRAQNESKPGLDDTA